jgi:hypothetical protein
MVFMTFENIYKIPSHSLFYNLSFDRIKLLYECKIS